MRYGLRAAAPDASHTRRVCRRVCTQLFQWVQADGSYNLGNSNLNNPAFTANSRLYCASQHGVGADNPTDPINLSPLDSARSMHVEILNTASFNIRYMLRNGNSATGRNFMFGGRPNLPLCVPPPPVVVRVRQRASRRPACPHSC